MTIISDTLAALFPSIGDVIAFLVLLAVAVTLVVAYLAHLYDLEQARRPRRPTYEQPKHVRIR